MHAEITTSYIDPDGTKCQSFVGSSVRMVYYVSVPRTRRQFSNAGQYAGHKRMVNVRLRTVFKEKKQVEHVGRLGTRGCLWEHQRQMDLCDVPVSNIHGHPSKMVQKFGA